jgi:hypothetical protein
MRSLTIHAASADSAHAIAAALCAFDSKLVGANGYNDVVVTFGDGNREIVRVLSALARYAADQVDAPARVESTGTARVPRVQRPREGRQRD